MTFSLKAIALVFAAGLVAALLVCLTLRPSPPNDEIQRLRDRAAWAMGQARALYQLASQRQVVLDTVYLVRVQRDTVTRRETDSVLVVLERENPGCGNVVAACERRLGIERANADGWKVQVDEQRENAMTFKTSADSARTAADSLRRALDLATRPPSFWKALLKPELRPSAGVGYCWMPMKDRATGAVELRDGPCANASLSLVWRF